VLWTHQWEELRLAKRLVLKDRKEALTETESACRRHAVLKHLDEFPVGHHRFFIALCQKFLLRLESRALFGRIVEFGVPVPHFGTCDDRLEALRRTFRAIHFLCKRRDK